MSPSPALTEKWVPLWPLAGQSMGELAYAETATDVSLPVAAQSAAATILTAPAITVDGATNIVVQAYLSYILSSGAGTAVFNLWDGSTDLGNIGQTTNPAATVVGYPMHLIRRLRPSAGTHTFSIRGWAQTGAWTAVGTAGGAQRQPMFLRISLAAPISNAPAGALVPVQYGTSLPDSPMDGQEAILVDSLTNPTYQWRFRYNAQSTSSYKWEFVGGRDASAEVTAAQAIGSSGAWVNLATDGPSITVPRAGDYSISWSALASQNNASAISMYAGPAIGNTNPVRYYGGTGWMINARPGIFNCGGIFMVPGIDVGSVIKLRYFASAVTAADQTFEQRFIAITPVRVS